jgi:hypothetical protein
MRPRMPMKPVIQQKMQNVASSSPDAPDRDLRKTRDQRCRWGLKPSARSGPERRKGRTVSRIVAFGVGVGRNHHAQGLRCHSSEPTEKAKSEPPVVGAAFYPRRSRFREEKSVLFFLFSKKMFSFGRFVFVFVFVFVFAFAFVFVFVFLYVCVCVCVFCFCVFLASRRRALRARPRGPEKGVLYGGRALMGPEKTKA